ncbi:MFS transporter [Corynebacterium sp. sy039]|uniref:MFS transporter n=1 Tax=Corynebacterium sp. sy039 TaxID=2599641 RepID=UPI0011B458CD|nr:MFS transporter [Corynebacterium sp. sy039]QDZ42465.1 multidrug efflux MFS transporter [Corynebacterium sp. sy039]
MIASRFFSRRPSKTRQPANSRRPSNPSHHQRPNPSHHQHPHLPRHQPISPGTLSPRTTFVFLLSAILPLLDSSLVNILLPHIAADFSPSPPSASPSPAAPASSLDAIGYGSIHYAISGYIFAAGVGIILSARCLERYGSRIIWYVSVAGFALASLAVGLAPNATFFILARLLQGVACGFIMPTVQHATAQLVGKNNMRTALATIGLPAVIAPAIGPLCGGLLADVLDWRWLFLINVPIAALALALAPAALVDLPRRPQLSRHDESSSHHTPHLSLIRNLQLYRHIPFASAMLLCALVGAVFYGTLLATSVHIQHDLHQPAWIAGVLLALQGVGAWYARKAVVGRLKGKNAFGIISAGLIITALSTLPIASISSTAALGTYIVCGLCCVLRGIGLGACTILALSAGYELVDARESAVVSAHSRLMVQFGGASGTVLVGVWAGSAPGLGAVFAVRAVCGAALSAMTARAARRTQ